MDGRTMFYPHQLEHLTMQSYWNPEEVYAATVFFHNQALHKIL